MGAWIMMTGFFLALSFAAITSMISTVELCVRNFVDHGYEREKSVLLTSVAIFIFGLPSALLWITIADDGTAFPQFLEVQDHIWGYGLMFSGLFIAFTIWKYGYQKWRAQVDEGKHLAVLVDTWALVCQHSVMISSTQEITIFGSVDGGIS